MGATNHTTNYNLSQFVGTDKPAWLQDYNGDMVKIDAGINAAKNAADNAANAASAAQNDATQALGDFSTLNTTVGTLSNTVGTAVGNINTINSLIGNGTPTTTDQTIIGAINELHGDISDKYAIADNSNQIIEVTADGVKTVAQLLAELKSEYNTMMANLGPDEAIIRTSLDVAGLITWLSTSAISLSRIAESGFYFERFYNNSGTLNYYRASLSNNAASCEANITAINISDSSITYTDNSNTIVASGEKLTLRYIKIRKLA